MFFRFEDIPVKEVESEEAESEKVESEEVESEKFVETPIHRVSEEEEIKDDVVEEIDGKEDADR